MPEELNLTLPRRDPRKPAPRQATTWLLGSILLGVLANLVVTWWRVDTPTRHAPAGGALPPEPAKQLAMKLEKQGLTQAAVQAWQEYLHAGDLSNDAASRIWYRLGKLHQEEKQYEAAVAAFYRSESLERLPELADDLGRRAQECLEAMGQFAALRYELAERVGLNPAAKTAGDEVVAEIGPQKITQAELDRAIEQKIEQQLAQYAMALPEEERKRQKEALFKQLASAEQRLQFLQQLVVESILYRQAREEKLAEDPATRALLLDLQRTLLAQRMMEKEMADQIKITTGDLQTYYQAHLKDYLAPPRAKIGHIQVAKEDQAQAALNGLGENGDFEALAKVLSTHQETRDQGGALDGWIETDGVIPHLGTLPEAQELIFQTKPGEVAKAYVKSAHGFHLIKVREREPERQRSFDEVRNQVFRDLRMRKEREVQEKLLTRLKERYDVVIHRSAFGGQLEPQTPATQP
ncbi:MAG: hypothetical protein FJ387_09900 [Verrucomicrobia bacterium]|nr:hypothetical protein [Verrucomicrobiota bacterium]